MKYELTSGIGGARKKKLLVLLASSSLLAGWGGQAAFADDDAAIKRLEAEIHRIEQRHQEEITALRAEIHHLRHAAGGPIYVTKGEVPPPGGPHVIETTKNGVHFGFADADGQNTVELTGRFAPRYRRLRRLPPGAEHAGSDRPCERHQSAPRPHRRHRQFPGRLALHFHLRLRQHVGRLQRQQRLGERQFEQQSGHFQ